MNNELYDAIFKRRSFHFFRNIGSEKISETELKDIRDYFYGLKPLTEGVRYEIKIVKDSTTCRVGQEYCILFYSEQKDNYLQNIGYLGEMLDLYLTSKNIGTLWYGMGKAKEKEEDGMSFVIMMAIAKVDSSDKFRTDINQGKRKDVDEIWHGDHYRDIADIVRYAPSAVNSQPWKVEATEKQLKVYRNGKRNLFSVMSKDTMIYFNSIDMGIFLCFLELCLKHKDISFERTLYVESDPKAELNLLAQYDLD
jgi:hypothetical protein